MLVGSLDHPGQNDGYYQYRCGNIERQIIGTSGVFYVSGYQWHEESKSPTDEDESVVGSEILGSKEVSGKSGHQRQTTAVLPVSDTQRDEKKKYALRLDQEGSGQKTYCGQNTINCISIAAADFVGIDAGPYSAGSVYKASEGSEYPRVGDKEWEGFCRLSQNGGGVGYD